MKPILSAAMLTVFLPLCAYAASDGTVPLISEARGDANISTVVVDTAPGTVSAMSLLGTSADDTSVVQNPRNLTLALQAFDSDKAFGLSLTPARTSLAPMNISTYNEHWWARVLAATTFSYAQGQEKVNEKNYDRRAVAIETSYFFFPHKDDPLVVYWDALSEAGKGPIDDKNPCVLIPAQKPDGVADDSLKESLDVRAQSCRDKVAKKIRWNVSRAWASWATGHYRLADSGESNQSLGKVAVLGLTWGLGDYDAPVAAAITVAGKRSMDSPVASTVGTPLLRKSDSSTRVLRIAIGSETLRLLIEGSKASESQPNILALGYKRAIGLDLRIAEGWWLALRAGKQRKIDNDGSVSGSSFSLSYSPNPLLKL